MLATLRQEARQLIATAHVPYSHRAEAVVLLLSDGVWIPGVRIENAAFPLTIPALLTARATALAAGRNDVVAAVSSSPFSPADALLLDDLGPFALSAPDALVRNETSLPALTRRHDPYLPGPAPASHEAGIRLARSAAEHAYVPESNFPVGAVLVTSEGKLIAGGNIEHPDWTRTLCAERTALGTAWSYGETSFQRLYLTCLCDAACTPCGACRQVLVELGPDLELVMDRGDALPEITTPRALLPGAFTGESVKGRKG